MHGSMTRKIILHFDIQERYILMRISWTSRIRWCSFHRDQINFRKKYDPFLKVHEFTYVNWFWWVTWVALYLRFVVMSCSVYIFYFMLPGMSANWWKLTFTDECPKYLFFSLDLGSVASQLFQINVRFDDNMLG